MAKTRTSEFSAKNNVCPQATYILKPSKKCHRLEFEEQLNFFRYFKFSNKHYYVVSFPNKRQFPHCVFHEGDRYVCTEDVSFPSYIAPRTI